MKHNYRIKQSVNKHLWYVLQDEKIYRVCHSEKKALLKMRHFEILEEKQQVLERKQFESV